MAELPKDQVSVKRFAVDSYAEVAAALDALLRWAASSVSSAPPTEATITDANVLPITGGLLAVRANPVLEVEAGFVEKVDFLNLADFRCVEVEMGSVNEEITLRHLAFNGAQVGEIQLVGGTDLTLNRPGQRVRLQRRGSRLVEIQRHFFDLGALTELLNDVNAQGNALHNLGRRFRDAPGAVIVVTDDRDTTIHVAGSQVTLATDPLGWRREDSVSFVQGGADLRFVPAANIVHPAGHDRGIGVGATMTLLVHALSNPMKWRLVGMTKTPAAAAVEIERVHVADLKTTTFITPTGNTAYQTAAGVTHDPPDNSSWLYLTTGAFSAAPNSSTNRAKVRIRDTLDAAGPEASAGRFSVFSETPGLALGRTYGVAPGTHTINLGILSADPANTAAIVQPGVVGLQLASDEFLGTLSADFTTTAPHETALQDAYSVSFTTLADDFLVFAFGTWTQASGSLGGTTGFSIDGTDYAVRNRGKDAAVQPGSFLHLKPITLSAGAHTFKLRAKSLATGVAMTVKAGSGFALLKKARFQDWLTNEVATELSGTSTTFAKRAGVNATLDPAWDYLVLGSCSLQLSTTLSTGGAQAKMVKGASDVSPTIRSMNRNDGVYSWNGTLFTAIVHGDGVSAQNVDLQWAAAAADPAALIADAAVAVLPLKRVA